MLVDTINHIFDIDCTISVDINNVSCIRGVTLQTWNSNRGEIWFCTVRLPNFPTLYTAVSLDATPSTQPPSVPPPPPSTPRRCRRQPCPRPRLQPSRRAVAVANPIPDPTFGFDATGGVPVVVPNPIAVPDPAAASLWRSVLYSSPLTVGEARPTHDPWGRGCRLLRSMWPGPWPQPLLWAPDQQVMSNICLDKMFD
jgi:hypothetical protein